MSQLFLFDMDGTLINSYGLWKDVDKTFLSSLKGILLETALGDHLHFGVTCEGICIDPEDFFKLG